MSGYSWSGREAFFLYNALIVNEFIFPFIRCKDAIRISLDEMRAALDILVSNIARDTHGGRVLFRELMHSQCIEFDEVELSTPSRIRKFMLAFYNKVVIDGKIMSLLLKDKRARRYTFASMRAAIKSNEQPPHNEIFGGAFFNDVKNGSFRDDLDSRLSKAELTKYIERCADIGVFPKATFSAHLVRWKIVERDYKMIDWVRRNDDKVVWAWGYLERKYLEGKKPEWISLGGKSSDDLNGIHSDALVLFYDLLQNDLIKESLMANLSRACAKKRFLEKQKDRTPSSYLLSTKVKQRLSALAEIDNKKFNKVIEDLINAEYDRRMRR
ncbi:hypothetical protein [Aeromonas media]|uniref:hypothetical protein n=1 Tax=Aeromonas media TaxID=651 RepID=UPI000FAFCE3A|nr:hypothetical protein [Aeromonas media]